MLRGHREMRPHAVRPRAESALSVIVAALRRPAYLVPVRTTASRRGDDNTMV